MRRDGRLREYIWSGGIQLMSGCDGMGVDECECGD